ncbi:PaaI family thioesterase [Yunchengibacter salinarum]|uniref:PaaI family thioesterase n=1 Tax=Yunchengibacter salinarum TaxID=3133399 RepID=UPI0035B618E2
MTTTNVPSMDFLGGRYLKLDMDAGEGLLEFRPTAAMCNPHGHVQGGLIGAMLDDACGMITYMAAGQRPFSTGTMVTDYFRPVMPDSVLIARARLVRGGRRRAIADATLFEKGAEERPLARATCHQTFLDVDRQTPADAGKDA